MLRFLGLPLSGGEWAKNRQHGVEVGQTGAETIDEIAEGKIPFEQILVIVLDVVGHISHERGMNLFEPGQRISAGVENVFVAILPTLQFGPLAGSLLASNLGELAGEFELLTLRLKTLALELESLSLEVD